MSEIERAIELLEEISFNIGLERDTEFAGDPEKFDMLCGKKELIDIATETCRAELDREKNPPTCDGCASLPTKYGSGVYMNAPCRICVRGITTRDYFKSVEEQKGEKA